MDMMHSLVLGVAPRAPSNLAFQVTGNGSNRAIVLSWADNSLNETSFTVQRALTVSGPWVDLVSLPAGTTTYTNLIGNTSAAFAYRVFASNVVGDTAVYAAPSTGFPTETMVSGFSNTAIVGILPAAPTNLTATLQTGLRALLTWTDNATDETGFVIEHATDGVNFSVLATVAARNNTGSVSYTNTNLLPGTTYTYRVAAINPAGLSGYSNLATLVVPTPPAAPSPLLATAVRVNTRSGTVTLTWPNVANETGYRIQRSTSPTFSTSVVTTSLGANVTTYTTGTISRTAQYYFRIQAYNAVGASAWVNATPFPIAIP